MSKRKPAPKPPTIANIPRKAIVASITPVNTDEVVINTVKTSTVATEVYGWSRDEVAFLDDILWLDISADAFCTQLEEIMTAMKIDARKTEEILTEKSVKSFAEVVWSLPQVQQLDIVRQTRSISEQEKPPDRVMDKPCRGRDCKSNRFRCFYGAPSSGDEQIRAWRICSGCGAYEDI